jgi:hypothetical protein
MISFLVTIGPEYKSQDQSMKQMKNSTVQKYALIRTKSSVLIGNPKPSRRTRK